MRPQDSRYQWIFLNSWLVALFVAFIAVTAQAADKPVGAADFNAADRL